MSYDLYIANRDFNYTWNLSKFFHTHIRYGEETGLAVLDGKTGSQSFDILANAINSIENEARKRPNGTAAWAYLGKIYDPENFWGDVLSASLFITDLLIAAKQHPKCKWRYSS